MDVVLEPESARHRLPLRMRELKVRRFTTRPTSEILRNFLDYRIVVAINDFVPCPVHFDISPNLTPVKTIQTSGLVN